MALDPTQMGSGMQGSGSVTLLVLFVLLAIGVSFLCSVLEAVLLSVTPAYVGALEDEKPRASSRLKGLKDNVDRPLAAILTLNTLAHTVGAMGAGAQASALFNSTVVGVFSALLTLAILFLSEIIPKTIGATYWKDLAPASSVVLKWMIWGLYPLVVLSRWMTRLISRGENDATSVSREELEAMVEQSGEQGVLDVRETDLFRNLLRFRALSARDVMTPRTVVRAFSQDATVQEVADADVPFTRLPVYEGTLDTPTGYVLRDDAVERVAADEHGVKLTEIKRPLITVPEGTPLPELFEQFVGDKEHVALVIDEFGGTEGVVSVEDVVETLLGLEIVDEADRAHDMQELARQRWKARAKKLGLEVDEDAAAKERKAKVAERDAMIRLGMTGEKPD